jgi:hypothetical protein
MDVNEQPSAGVVVTTGAVGMANRILLCIDTDNGMTHIFTMDTEQAVSLIAKLEAAYCCQLDFPNSDSRPKGA